MLTKSRSSWSGSFSRCQFLQLLVPVFPCPYEIFGPGAPAERVGIIGVAVLMQPSIAVMRSSRELKSTSFRLLLNIAIMPALPFAPCRDPVTGTRA